MRSIRPALLACGLLVLGCTDLHIAPELPVVEVRVQPDTLILRIGDSSQVLAFALDSTSTLQAQRVATWVTAAPSVVSVDSAGKVRAVGAGTTTLTGSVGGFNDAAIVIVTGAPKAMAVFQGNGQSAAVNSAVSTAPAVRVLDAGGNPVSNVEVTFAAATGGGNVAPTTAITNLNGVASTAWVLGPAAGANTMTATAPDTGVTGNPVTFTATATVGPPSGTTSTVDAEPNTIGPSSGSSLSTITVTVRDALGSTIVGASVTLSATGTGNTLTQPAGTTDNQGRISGSLSSTVAESKVISATINGSVAVTNLDTIVVSSASATGLKIFTQPAGATANQNFSTQPVVDVVDGFGNRSPSATNAVTVSVFSGNGTLVGGPFTVNAVAGRATFSALLIRGIRTTGDTLGTGPHVLQFSTPGFNAVRSDTFAVAVSHAYNVQEILTRTGCNSCHGWNGTHASIVNAATTFSCTPGTKVVPSDTTASVLYAKIKTATPSCGGVMPTGGLISVIQRNLIRDWILQGAPNN